MIPSRRIARSEPDASSTLLGTGEEEYYDLRSDPFELDNRSADRSLRSRTAELRHLLRRTCRPRPPGYRIP